MLCALLVTIVFSKTLTKVFLYMVFLHNLKYLHIALHFVKIKLQVENVLLKQIRLYFPVYRHK